MRPSDLRVPEPWLPSPPPPAPPGVAGALVRGAIGGAVGALFWIAQWRTLAIVVWSVAGLITAATVASPAARAGLARVFGLLGVGLGKLASGIFLVPLFFLGFSAVRLAHRLGGRDPLRLKIDDRPSYWLPCDSEARSHAQVRALFAAERPPEGGQRRWPVLLLALIALFGLAEGVLRGFGYGDPVLYVNDPTVGYRPAPDQRTTRRGNLIEINHFGMRSAPITREKPAGTFRILMLGDSTLYGGAYIDQDAIFANRLDALLEAEGRAVEVLNMGVNGWGPYHQAAWLERFGTFDADLVIFIVPYGDIFRPLTGLTTKPYLTERPALALVEVAHHLMWRARQAAVGKPPEALREKQGAQGLVKYSNMARAVSHGGTEVMVDILPSRRAGTVGPTEEEMGKVLTLVYQLGHASPAWPTKLFAAEGAAAYHDHVHLAGPGHARYAAYLKDRVLGSAAWQAGAR